MTGGSRGIGKGIALGLAAAGATVYITGRTRTEGTGAVPVAGSIASTVAEAEAEHGRILGIVTDHRDDAQSEAAVQRVLEEQGRLDVLVNSAWAGYEGYATGEGEPPDAPFWQKPVSYWDVNLAGPRWSYVVTRSAAPAMVAAGSGLVVTVSFACDPGDPAYGVAKTASNRLVLEWQAALGSHGITSVGLHPGLVRTEIVDLNAQYFDMSEAESLSTSAIPWRRWLRTARCRNGAGSVSPWRSWRRTTRWWTPTRGRDARRNKAQVSGRRVLGLPLPSGRSVAETVVRGAEDVNRPSRPGAGTARPVPRPGRCAAAGRVARRPPAGGPLPGVAGHVEQAVAVGRELTRPGTCRRSRRPAGSRHGNSPCQVLAMIALVHELSSPQANGLLQPAAGGELPLGLGRQRLAGPGRVRRASKNDTCVTGWRSRPSTVLPGPSGWRQSAPGVQAHQRV